MNPSNTRPAALALCASLIGGLALSSTAFALKPLEHGYMLSAVDHDGPATEGKCGEGKCGAEKEENKDTEGKCGAETEEGDEDKDTEGKCGEGKCGEGKCGGNV